MTTRGATVSLLLLLAACRAAPRLEAPAPLAAPADTLCTIAAGPAAGRDTVTFALAGPVDPTHAPVPRNDAERVVFAHLYETLIRVDCAGRVRPGLAGSWEQDGGRRWTFVLRDDARFWDGAPVTTRDVLATWSTTAPLLARTATAEGDGVLKVSLSSSAYQLFADPALAVTKPAPGGGWPIGTGDHWVTNVDATSPALLWVRPVPEARHPVLKVTTVSGSGARDAIDEGADLLVTSDPAALEYVRTRPEYVEAPLEWSRTYVLLAPDRTSLNPAALRRESLPQAVRVDARPATPLNGGHSWFSELEDCALPAARDTVAARPARRRVVYSQGDRSASDLAARLVGSGVLGAGAVATSLAPGAFELALHAGNEAAYVLPLRRRVFDSCRAALELPSWSLSGAIEPLVDTRVHAVVRRGLPRLEVDWEGAVRLAPP